MSSSGSRPNRRRLARAETRRDSSGPPTPGSDNKPDASTTSNTLEAKRRAFQDLVNGEYKDIYTEETQRIIDRRFRETRNLEQQVGQYQPVIDMLMQRYQIGDGDMGKLIPPPKMMTHTGPRPARRRGCPLSSTSSSRSSSGRTRRFCASSASGRTTSGRSSSSSSGTARPNRSRGCTPASTSTRRSKSPVPLHAPGGRSRPARL